jgi:hypothetical protein
MFAMFNSLIIYKFNYIMIPHQSYLIIRPFYYICLTLSAPKKSVKTPIIDWPIASDPQI